MARNSSTNDPVIGNNRTRAIARESSRRLSRFANQDLKMIIAEANEALTLPAEVVGLLVDLLSQLAQGRAVTMMSYRAELTTQQAADFLGVSKPFLVKQLEEQVIPFTKVGTDRRVKFEDLLAFKKSVHERRLKSLEELSALDQELGLQ